MTASSDALKLFDLQAQKWSTLAEQMGYWGYPTFSRDGQVLYALNNSGLDWAVYRIPIVGGKPVRLIDLAGVHLVGAFISGLGWTRTTPRSSCATRVQGTSTPSPWRSSDRHRLPLPAQPERGDQPEKLPVNCRSLPPCVAQWKIAARIPNTRPVLEIERMPGSEFGKRAGSPVSRRRLAV